MNFWIVLIGCLIGRLAANFLIDTWPTGFIVVAALVAMVLFFVGLSRYRVVKHSEPSEKEAIARKEKVLNKEKKRMMVSSFLLCGVMIGIFFAYSLPAIIDSSRSKKLDDIFAKYQATCEQTIPFPAYEKMTSPEALYASCLSLCAFVGEEYDNNKKLLDDSITQLGKLGLEDLETLDYAAQLRKISSTFEDRLKDEAIANIGKRVDACSVTCGIGRRQILQAFRGLKIQQFGKLCVSETPYLLTDTGSASVKTNFIVAMCYYDRPQKLVDGALKNIYDNYQCGETPGRCADFLISVSLQSKYKSEVEYACYMGARTEGYLSYARYCKGERISETKPSSASTYTSTKPSSGKRDYNNSYEDGYDDYYMDGDYDWDRYRTDTAYRDGVDDAMEEEDEWGEEW